MEAIEIIAYMLTGASICAAVNIAFAYSRTVRQIEKDLKEMLEEETEK